MNICKRCRISGKVQGVFFRASARDKARSLQVTGHAKNLDDGSVEVIACGTTANVNALTEWLKEGPRMARVDSVEVEEIEIEVPEKFVTL